MLNFPGEAADFANRYTAPVLPKFLTTPVKDLPALLRGENTPVDTGEFPKLTAPNLGDIAQPRNTAEAYGSAAVAGGAAALTGGVLSRVPALLSASGKEIAGELPRLLHEAGIAGAAPGIAVEAANQNTDLDKLGPAGKEIAEAAIGATAAVAAHHFVGTNPIEGVASKLGDSQNSDEAGQVAQAKVRDWRTGLNAKLDALKGEAYGPVGDPTNAAYGRTMFGKVPLDTATTDNTETMRTLGELASQGGVYKDVLHAFVSDMPPRMKGMFDAIAQRNNPITVYPPQAEAAVPKGPLRTLGGGPEISVGPGAPQALQTVPAGGEVGFHIPEPDSSPNLAKPIGTTVGFRAPVEDTMSLRSAVGEWIANPKLMPKGVNEAQASALYKSLTADIGNTMEQYGAGDEWADYNAKASGLYHAGNLLSKIAGDVNPTKDNVTGGKAIQALWGGMRKDSGEIANLRDQVPEAADEVAAAFLRNHPEKWNSLPSATQQALVPNPFDRLVLNSSAVKKPDLVTETSRNREPFTTGALGYGAATLLEPHGDAMGSTSLMSPSAWSALAIAAPPAIRFLGRLKENPRLLNLPITGAIAGGASSPLVSPAAKSE
jgi:hypothetical protein